VEKPALSVYISGLAKSITEWCLWRPRDPRGLSPWQRHWETAGTADWLHRTVSVTERSTARWRHTSRDHWRHTSSVPTPMSSLFENTAIRYDHYYHTRQPQRPVRPSTVFNVTATRVWRADHRMSTSSTETV